jgi:hypothetical protein
MRETTPPERVPGNFYFFKMFIEITIDGKAYVGCPKQAIRIRTIGRTTPVIRWGSPVELAWPNPAFPRARWVDEPFKGLAGRNIYSAEDLLGATGTLGGKKCCFESILEVGKNQVVFSLFCPEDQTRIGYGFPRQIFAVRADPEMQSRNP